MFKMTEGEKLITTIRTQLLMHHPWFGSLAMRLRCIEDNNQPTLCTDATVIRYNLEFLKQYSIEYQIGVFAHEIMHCFDGETLVMTDHGLRPIKEIQLGDSVYSDTNGKGLFTKVVANANRLYQGRMFKVKPAFGLEFNVTSEHPILCVRLPKAPKAGDGIPKTVSKLSSINPEFINAEDLNANTDLLAFPLPAFEPTKKRSKRLMRMRRHFKYEHVELNADTAYFFGAFVGDGSLAKPCDSGSVWFKGSASKRNVLLTLGLQKPIQKLNDIISQQFYRKPLISKLKDTNAVRLQFSSTSIAKYLAANFYSGDSKSIPAWMFNQSDDIKRAFIQGLTATDGHLYDNGKRDITTTSLNVAGNLSLLLMQLGYSPAISKTDRQSENANHADLFKISWFETKNVESRGVVRDGYWLMPIRSIQVQDVVDTTVYNIETESHTYGLPYVMTHNCALLHPFRRNGRDPKRWNIAADHAINLELRDCGFKLPAGALMDDQYKGMSAESIYAMLPEDPPGGGDDCPTGSFEDAPNPQGDDQQSDDDQGGGDDDQMKPYSESDWQIAVEKTSMTCRKSGKMEGGTDNLVKQSRDKGSNWVELLRRFVEQFYPRDYSYAKPSRRGQSLGVVLPSPVKESLPRLVLVVDTSGSIYSDPELVQIFADELTTILHDARPEQLDVLYCDTSVKSVETFQPDDPEVEIRMVGGGGTLFQPAFDYLADKDDQPVALIYLTDLECSDQPLDPGYPVLWSTTEKARVSPPEFGEVITLSKWK